MTLGGRSFWRVLLITFSKMEGPEKPAFLRPLLGGRPAEDDAEVPDGSDVLRERPFGGDEDEDAEAEVEAVFVVSGRGGLRDRGEGLGETDVLPTPVELDLAWSLDELEPKPLNDEDATEGGDVAPLLLGLGECSPPAPVRFLSALISASVPSEPPALPTTGCAGGLGAIATDSNRARSSSLPSSPAASSVGT